MKLSLICAMAENRVIGINNSLPWHLSEDLKYFKRTTMGCSIIMGRKTWESIGRPLPGRKNIVVSRNPDYQAEGIHCVTSLAEAIRVAEAQSFIDGSEEAFVIGGAVLYQAALPLADCLHVTHVHADVEGDTWFPEISWNDWQELAAIDYAADEKNGYAYKICRYERLRNSVS